MAQLPTLNEADLEASICKDSFYDFVRVFWDTVIPEEPVWNWHIEYLCKELQIVAERVFAGKPKEYDLIINISPGSTKSTIASIMFPAWIWTRMPSARCICGSYAYTLSMDLSRHTRDLIRCDRYREYFPEVSIRPDQDSKAHFALTKGGMRFAVGVDGLITGFHAHFLIVDDPLNPKQAASDVTLKAANDWMGETLPSRKVDKRVTPTILIMQRLAQHDPTGVRLEKKKASPVRHICLPAEISPLVSPPELAKNYVNGLMDPIRLSRQVLREALGELGPFGYAGQYDQNPVPRGGGMFHVDKFKHGPCPHVFKRTVRYWDKAGVQGGGAFTVGAKLALDFEGHVWILDIIRGQWDASRRERLILQTAVRDGYGVEIGIEQEPGSGGKESAESSVRNLAGYRVRVNKVGKSDGDKAARADPFATQVNSGNVYIVQDDWNDEYLKEMRFFPASKYKDQADASSGAYNILSRPHIIVGGMW